MWRFQNAKILNAPGLTLADARGEGTAAEPLEVNVIFTELRATAAAMEAAESFARQLGAHIRLRAAIAVPMQLPLDQPLVSVDFLEKALRNLANQSEPDGPERTIHIYICRDCIETLSEVLKPESIVVIGACKRWWLTKANRVARALRANHNRVIVVGKDRQTQGLHSCLSRRWPI